MEKITIAIITISAGWQWELEKVDSFDNEESALVFVNEAAEKWWKEGEKVAEALGGSWTGEFEKFSSLRYTPVLEANGGEENFMAVLDAASQRRLYQQE